jgi:hypothetical protein
MVLWRRCRDTPKSPTSLLEKYAKGSESQISIKKSNKKHGITSRSTGSPKSRLPVTFALGYQMKIFKSIFKILFWMVVAYIPVYWWRFERTYSAAIGCPKRGDC